MSSTGTGAGPAEVTGVWMPNAIEPAVRCPSTRDTMRQFTVYTPLASGRRPRRNVAASPATACRPPAPNDAPDTSSTWTDDSRGSGASVKVRLTVAGACWRRARSAGSDDCSTPWARATGAVANGARSANATRAATAAALVARVGMVGIGR